MKKTEIEIYREIGDTEITIHVTAYVTIAKPWRGSAQSCPSSGDYYGYTEVDDIEAHDENGAEVSLTENELVEATENLIGQYVSDDELRADPHI